MFWIVFEKCCEKFGESPNYVARQLDLSNATTTKWKNGAIPRADTLKKIADYFGVTTDYLLGGGGDPEGSFKSADGSNLIGNGNAGVVAITGQTNTINTINCNNNIVGNGNSPPEPLNEQEIALVNLFRTLDEIERAEVIAAAARFRRARLNQETQ